MIARRLLQLGLLALLLPVTSRAQSDATGGTPAPATSPEGSAQVPATDAPPPPADAPIASPAAGTEPVAGAALGPGVQGPPAGATHRVRLKDGQELLGKVIREDASGVELELAGGVRLFLPGASVEAVGVEARADTRSGTLHLADPNRTRYFFAPSGMMLEAGEGSLSQVELVISQAAYGVHDNVSVVVGALIPAWFAGTNGFNVLAAAKVGGSFNEYLHVAGGAYGVYAPGIGLGAAGIGFGTITAGDPDLHASLSVGIPFAVASATSSISNSPIYTLSGNWRVGRNVALITENWFLTSPNSSTVFGANALGARFMWDRIALDLGGVFFFSSQQGFLTSIPIPWLTFTYNFG